MSFPAVPLPLYSYPPMPSKKVVKPKVDAAAPVAATPVAAPSSLAAAKASVLKTPPAVPAGMVTVMRHHSELKRYPNNPRRNAHAVPVVMKSLREFGWRQPVVLDKDDFIVVGDTRYQGAVQLSQNDKSWEWVPCVRADDLTPAQITAYRLADNRVGEASEWDDTKLMQELGLIAEEGFDLAGMGFTEAELYENTKVVKKEDVRYLEDFDVMPMPKPKFILISAPEDKCATILGMINAAGFGKDTKVEYTGDPSPTLAEQKKAA